MSRGALLLQRIEVEHDSHRKGFRLCEDESAPRIPSVQPMNSWVAPCRRTSWNLSLISCSGR